MKRVGSLWIRLSVTLAAGLVGCLHTVAPKVPPTGRLELSESASGPHGRAPFAVVAAGPRGEIPTASEPGITLVFNRAMRPIDGPPREGLPSMAISTGDGRAVPGHFRWVGTHGVLFEPEGRLPGASRFSVTVPRGTRALDGSELANEYRLEFSTERPQLLTTFPGPGTRQARAEDPIFLKFSQPIDPAELQKHLQISATAAGQQSKRPIQVAIQHGAPQWVTTLAAPPQQESAAYERLRTTSEPSGLWLALTPNQPLPLDSDLEISVTPGLRSLEGPLGTETPIKIALYTFGPLRLVDLRCARQNLGRCQAHRDFTAVLSNPVHPDEFRRHLKITGPARPAKPNANAPKPATHAKLEHPLALDPDYGDRFRITLRAGMTDLFGQKLAKDTSVDVLVEEPFVAAKAKPANAPAPEEVAAESYSGEQPETAPDGTVQRRPRLKYGLEIGVRGHILEALGGPGGSAGPSAYKIPISAVNVPTYGLSTSALPEASVVRRILGAEAPVSNGTRWVWMRPGTPKNTRTVEQLDMRALLEGSATGAASIALAGLGQLESTTQTMLNVTDLGISARVSRFGSLVWVTRLSTGSPVADAQVSVYNASGDVVGAARTDAQGLVTFAPKDFQPIRRQGDLDPTLLLVARLGNDFTYQRIERASVAFEGTVDYLQKGQWVGLVFTDRGVYRPGETVKLGGYFRRTAERGFLLLPGQEYEYQISDSQGEVIAIGQSKLDPYGAIAADVVLPKSAAFGRATLSVRLGRRDEEQFSAAFELLAYKPAEFKVAVEPREREVVHGQAATFTVSSEYLFGSPVTEARVEQYVTRTETTFLPAKSEGFVVEDSTFLQDLRYTTQRGTAYSQATGELDSLGRLTRTIALDAPQQDRPELVTFEAEVQDLSRQTQAGRASVFVHPAQFYLGLKQPKKRFLAIGAELPADVAALTPKGTRQAGVSIQLELWRRTWTAAVEDRAADALHYKTNVRDEDAGHCMVTSSNDVAGCRLRLGEPGYYVLRASARDALGNPVHSSLGLYAVDDRADQYAAPIGWEHPDRRALVLEPDQKKYQPGETARILVKNPFKEATALLTVERAGILERRVVQLRGKMPVVEVPIQEAYFPNAYVSLHLVRGRVAAMPAPGAADVGAPEFRVGYTALRVDPESRRLKVDVSAARKEYRPGETVDAKVALRRVDGAPSAGTVTFYVVDEGVLLLTGYKTPDPLPAFAEPRSLGVVPIESRENLAQILKLRNGERIPILGYEIADSGNADKGNEVGGGGEMPGRIRSDFRTTVYFEAGRPVSSDGLTTFHFKLPDNLTNFRLMAVAAGVDDRFGFGEGSITTNRKLMARPAMPRGLRVGDELDAGIIVTSKGLSSSAVDVSLNAKGVTVTGPTTRRVTLPANGQTEVRFPVKAVAAGEASFEFSARTGAEVDRVRVTRKVEQPLRWLTAAAYGTTDKAAAIGTGDLKDVRKDRGALSVTLSSSALVGLKSVFEELSTYPYGCTEQLASRVLPLLSAQKLAEQQNFQFPAKHTDAMDEALGEIAKRQRYDGSFGYWQDDPEGHTWLTAYALLALEQGSKAGYFVPKRLRDQAAAYLLRTLDRLTNNAGEPDAEDESGTAEGAAQDSDQPPSTADSFVRQALGPKERVRFGYAEACFVADVLARTGQLDPSRVNKLRMHEQELALSSKIQLLSAMARLRMPRQELEAVLGDILRNVTVGPAEARVETSDPALSTLLESPTRSTAVLLDAVLAIDPKSPLAPKLARGLVRLRTGASYRNTQEDAWALLALESYRKTVEADPPNFSTEVYFAEERVADFAFRGLPVHAETASIPADLLLAHPGAEVAVQVVGEGTAHYAMQLRLAKDGASRIAIDEGFSVERLTRALEPAELKEAARLIPEQSQLRAGLGQLVLVDVLLESAEPRDQVVLEDPLPSGLEPVEFGFDTTAQALSVSEDPNAVRRDPHTPKSSRYGVVYPMTGVHREMRDGEVLHFIPHVDAGIYHFRYLARATTPGQFVVPPTRAVCMYDPEIFGQSRSVLFQVGSSRK